MRKLLLVDDDRFLLDSLKRALVAEGYEVSTVNTGEEALCFLSDQDVDLVILDVGLPGIDGITTCRRIRAKITTPIIMLTARTDALDKVVGLEVGADDYLTKPFELSELAARVRAQLRRATEYGSQPQRGNEKITVGNLTIDGDLRDVLVDGVALQLTTKEFELVAYLAKNLNRAVSRDSLFEEVWGYDSDFNTNSLDVYMHRVRKKIEQDSNNPQYLHTMRGYGYKMTAP